jgi:cell division protease FtsH
VTSGATGDIQQATKMAKAMVTQMGYSTNSALVAYGDHQEEVFLGMSMGRSRTCPRRPRRRSTAEVAGWSTGLQSTPRRSSPSTSDEFVAVAEALLEYETLTGDEIRDLIAGKRPTRDDADTPHAPRGSAVPSAGKGRKRDEPDTGLEPQPQA